MAKDKSLKNRLARAVFEAAELLGISDRDVVGELAKQVIERLEGKVPLPGFEKEVLKGVSEDEVKAIAEEIIEVKGTQRARAGTLKLTPTARSVLEKRYLLKDEKGNVVETPEELIRRVAHHIAQAEKIYNPDADVEYWEEEFYRLMINLEFLPNSPTLMNAGRELGQLSACFVLPIDDSMDAIFDAVKYTALIHKSGGGTGFSFSRLRPEGDKVGSTGGVASGPVSFMKAFDMATEVIKQGGMRRGANMGILHVSHPDIFKFIDVKKDPKALTNFNISVAVDDEFMRAVYEDREYKLVNPRDGKVWAEVRAKEIFDRIAESAWLTGDPGVVFIDRINRDNPTPHLGKIESTNPCGEQPLLPFESCNLGSINLSKMVRKRKPEIDWDKLERTVKICVRFLDNVIDVNKYPLPQIERMTKATRKIGLGVMGFADMLIKLGVRYDSEEALKIAEEVMSFIDEKAFEASCELAEERGVFPAFKGSIYDVPGGPKVRNATRTTIAPTGTLSIIAGCSSGIEPIFAICYIRTILDGTQFVEVHPLFEEVAKKEGFYSEELMRKIARKGNLQGIEEVPPHIRELFRTAYEIAPEWHVRMQAAFQKHTNNAVSKTVNLPQDATVDDVKKVYFLAYELGCKGITIYRDRSREEQVLKVGEERAKVSPKRRPRITKGITERVSTGCGNLYVTVNFDDDRVFEVFTSLGKAGGCASAQLEAISRLISLALRSGIDIGSIIKQLKGIRCPSIAWEDGHLILSCADAIGGVLERHASREEKKEEKEVERAYIGQCPECSSNLVYQEGCFVCPGCGYTKCL